MELQPECETLDKLSSVEKSNKVSGTKEKKELKKLGPGIVQLFQNVSTLSRLFLLPHSQGFL